VVQRGIFDAQMDSRLEGRIKFLNPIGGEEKSALIILKKTEEDCNESISFHIISSVLGQEEVGLV
jgi:hypothetical protein